MIRVFPAMALLTALAAAQDVRPVNVERERALIERLQASLDARYRYSRDPAVLSYVNRLGARIAPQSIYHVLATSDVFATAFPGAHVYVTVGLLSRAQDEAELAGVLAHEAAHSALGFGRPAGPPAHLRVAFTGPEGGVCLRFGGAPLAVTRERESAADLQAAPLLKSAGYSPTAMIDFFEQLLPATADLSSERIVLAESAPADSVINTSAFEAMQLRLQRPAPRL